MQNTIADGVGVCRITAADQSDELVTAHPDNNIVITAYNRFRKAFRMKIIGRSGTRRRLKIAVKDRYMCFVDTVRDQTLVKQLESVFRLGIMIRSSTSASTKFPRLPA